MVCDVCKEHDAVVELVQVEGGEKRHVHLCERCAAERGVEMTVSTPKHPLADFLLSVQPQVATGAGDASRCAFCSATLKDFRASGRLGCAQCYGAFGQQLRELLRRVHGNSRHTGRRSEPPRPERFEHATQLGDLRERLQRAIESEQFELAADLRDKIRAAE